MSNDLLREEARSFATEASALIQAVLPRQPFLGVIEAEDGKVIVASADKHGTFQQHPLYMGSKHVGSWTFVAYGSLDSSGKYLKTHKVDMALYRHKDRTPLVRLEHNLSYGTAPVTHWQFHAERGSFTDLLSRSNTQFRSESPNQLAKLHLPVGGPRMRPSIEDFLQFLVQEVGVDYMPDWKKAVNASRKRFREIQLRSTVRDMPDAAAQELKELGWTVIKPDGPRTRAAKNVPQW